MKKMMLLLLLAGCEGERSPLYEELASQGPLVIAHRGGDDLAPESTVLAFQRAWDAGAHVLEVDIQRSVDGVLYIFHDATLDRTTEGTGPIADLTWDELSVLDAAYDWTRDGGETYPLRGTGIGIPTLEDLFEQVPGAVWNLDIKSREPEAVGEVSALITQYGLEDKVCVGSFDDGIGRAFREEFPGACTYYSEGLARWALLGDILPLDSAPAPRYEILEVPLSSAGITIVNEAFVKRTHRRNQMAWVWTVNEASEMERLFEMGVDGLITDEVELALEKAAAAAP